MVDLEELLKYDLLDVAWAAGILEGEGCFIPINRRSVRIQVGSIDEDIIIKLVQIFNCGTISSRMLPSNKRFYIWIVTNKKDFLEVVHLILPFMGKRRTSKIEECIAHCSK